MGGLSLGGAALTGGMAGAVITLFTRWVSGTLRIWKLSRSLVAYPQRQQDNFGIRVCNRSVHTIEDATAYISLGFDPQTDVLDGYAFIGTHYRIGLCEDRLCWSIAAPDPNPFRIDIFPGEKQALDFVRFHADRIEIPSEQGWADEAKGKRSRVFLKKKHYEGELHLVARNTLRRSFDLVIDPTTGQGTVTLKPVKFINVFVFLFRGVS